MCVCVCEEMVWIRSEFQATAPAQNLGIVELLSAQEKYPKIPLENKKALHVGSGLKTIIFKDLCCRQLKYQ